jgi:hypothetical protein
MQGKGLSLRLSLVALVVVLVFGTLGGFSLARDAFDADYDDCPAATRLDAVDGLTIDRTDEEDEIRISWDALSSASLSSLGPNGYRARLTVIVDGEDARNVALGDTDLVVSDIDFAEDLTVSVAITLSDYVISDIAEADFTSGLPAPRFSSNIWVSGNTVTVITDPAADAAADRAEYAVWRRFVRVSAEDAGAVTPTELTAADTGIKSATDGDRGDAILAISATSVDDHQLGTADEIEARGEAATAARVPAANVVIDGDDRPAEDADGDLRDLGTFYYLGFNNLFDNWYVESGVAQRPRTAKFRVGLQHGASGVNAGDADFENYRIVIEDSSGDLLGYQAETVSASGTYGSNKIVFSTGTDGTPFLTGDVVGLSTDNFTNIRLSNRVTDNGAVSPYFAKTYEGGARPAGMRTDLTYGNVGLVNAKTNTFPEAGVLYADSPVEFFDFPRDIFETDGSYTIKAWAEDDDGTRISPQASIVLGAAEREPARGAEAGVGPYVNGIRSFSATAEANLGNTLTVYGFSIQDE